MNSSPRLTWLETVDSTNLYALRHYNELEDGDSIAALEQTAGRGREGRQWFSPPGRNLYLSFLIKHPPEPAYRVSIIAALAALDLVRQLCPEAETWLKWPNDLCCGNQKLAGILCEGKISDGKIQGIVAGIGINLNSEVSELAALDRPATSLKIVSGVTHDLHAAADFLANRLRHREAAFRIDQDAMFQEWKNENKLVGQHVTAACGGDTRSGIITAINDDGSLDFTADNGETSRYLSGDFTISREALDQLFPKP